LGIKFKKLETKLEDSLDNLSTTANYFFYFYGKTNQMHNISNLFYFETTFYMFRTVFPSIIRSLRLYIQHHTIQVLWMLVSKQP